MTRSDETLGNRSILERRNQVPISSKTSGRAYAPQPIQRSKRFVQGRVRPPEEEVIRLRRVKRPITIRIMPAMSILRSVDNGWDAVKATLLRAVGVLLAVEVLEREVCVVLFLARLGAREVVLVLFLLAVDFLVLLLVVLRAIAILLTFRWSTNYSMRAWGLWLPGAKLGIFLQIPFANLTCTIKQNCYNLHITENFYITTPPSL